jgi:hypothetical protein
MWPEGIDLGQDIYDGPERNCQELLGGSVVEEIK